MGPNTWPREVANTSALTAPLTVMAACWPSGVRTLTSVTLGTDVTAAVGHVRARLVHEFETGDNFRLHRFEKGRPQGPHALDGVDALFFRRQFSAARAWPGLRPGRPRPSARCTTRRSSHLAPGAHRTLFGPARARHVAVPDRCNGAALALQQLGHERNGYLELNSRRANGAAGLRTRRRAGKKARWRWPASSSGPSASAVNAQ